MNPPTPICHSSENTLVKVVVAMIFVGIALLTWEWFHARAFTHRQEHTSRPQAHAAP